MKRSWGKSINIYRLIDGAFKTAEYEEEQQRIKQKLCDEEKLRLLEAEDKLKELESEDQVLFKSKITLKSLLESRATASSIKFLNLTVGLMTLILVVLASIQFTV